jgi:hypothetical protein
MDDKMAREGGAPHFGIFFFAILQKDVPPYVDAFDE